MAGLPGLAFPRGGPETGMGERARSRAAVRAEVGGPGPACGLSRGQNGLERRTGLDRAVAQRQKIMAAAGDVRRPVTGSGAGNDRVGEDADALDFRLDRVARLDVRRLTGRAREHDVARLQRHVAAQIRDRFIDAEDEHAGAF